MNKEKIFLDLINIIRSELIDHCSYYFDENNIDAVNSLKNLINRIDLTMEELGYIKNI